jgi:hypothetical protein
MSEKQVERFVWAILSAWEDCMPESHLDIPKAVRLFFGDDPVRVPESAGGLLSDDDKWTWGWRYTSPERFAELVEESHA